MQSSESVAKISSAVAEAQAEFKAVSKSGFNAYDKYAYADLEDYVHATRPVLTKHGLAILSSAEEVVALNDRTTKNGGCEHAVRVKVNVRLMHTSGEWVECVAWGEGQDRADKAVYKAITGARKYGLALMLGLATSDDPERDEAVGQPNHNQVKAPPAPKQPAAPSGPMADEEFGKALTALESAWTERNIPPSEADKIVATVLKKKNVGDLRQASREFFRDFIKAIKAGKFDPKVAA